MGRRLLLFVVVAVRTVASLSLPALMYTSGSEACDSLAPWGQTTRVADEVQLAAALLDPLVSCILFSERSIRLTADYWGPGGGFFQDRNCVRYQVPLCDFQVLNRTVVLAPAFANAYALLILPPVNAYYFNVVEFISPGKLYTVNLAVLGVPTPSAAFLDLTAVRFTPAVLEFMDNLLANRNVVGGSFEQINSVAFTPCATREATSSAPTLVLGVLGAGSNDGNPTSNIFNQSADIGVNAPFADDVDPFESSVIKIIGDTYVFEPLSVAYTFRIRNSTFACCNQHFLNEMLGPNDLCNITADVQSNRMDSLEFAVTEQDSDGSIIKTTIYRAYMEELSHPDAQAMCKSQYGGELAQFSSIVAFESTMRNIFSATDFDLPHIYDRYLWIGDSVSHGEMVGGAPGTPRRIPAAESFWEEQDALLVRSCTMVSTRSLLLAAGDCSQEQPFMCMRTEGGGGGGGSSNRIDLLPVILGSVAGLAIAALLFLYVVYRHQGRVKGGDFRVQGEASILKASSGSPLFEDAWGAEQGSSCDSPTSPNTQNAMSQLHQRHQEQLDGRPVLLCNDHNSFMRESVLVKREGNGSIAAEEYEATNNAPAVMALAEMSLNELYDLKISGPCRRKRVSGDSEVDPDELLLQDVLAACAKAFEEYEFVSQIGVGTHGMVLALKEKSTGELYAAKVPLHCDIEPLVQEAYILHQIKHPNVVALKEAILGDSMLILITELAVFGDVEHLVADLGNYPPTFNEHLAMQVLYQIGLSLTYLHENFIAHRDVKPANIVIGPDGILKLIDFGVSRILMGTSTTFAGTPSHMAPEILVGQPYSRESDIWSLGSVIYLICVGVDVRTTKQAMDIATLKDMVSKDDGKTKLEVPSSCFRCEELHNILERMLDSDPSARPTASEICSLEWLTRFCSKQHSIFIDAITKRHEEGEYLKNEDNLQTQDEDSWRSLPQIVTTF
uniref:non-specific serine/threonine protein kinase n=1 Tax=Pyramimonas obovata TaxID=1411642 RepID=A0A7S0QVF4_9CHLO|mmetsp:Transcript_14047/g.30021  ORF Transcript_14047/g.30021 Transcript_14047/m.30021 type:complete len:954 (+) Transcript_14047:226-3087(+)